MSALPSWLTTPLWDQFAALLPERPRYDPAHPLRCHRSRIPNRIVFDKLIQVLRFGCSYQEIADTTCSATTIRNRRDEWMTLDIFEDLKHIVLLVYDRMVGLLLDNIAVDGCITKAPGGGDCAGPSPLIAANWANGAPAWSTAAHPLGGVSALASTQDCTLLAPTLDTLDDLGPLPDKISVHLDYGYV